ncbi:unnamed protein product, partial [marine sediment metagenome]
YYKTKEGVKFPIAKDVFDYLYDITNGRLRYIFGLIYVLTTRLHIGKLVQTVSADLAKGTISALAKERMKKFALTKVEMTIIEALVKKGELNVANLAKCTSKNRSYISRAINKLLVNKIVHVRQEGKQRIYTPSLDAKIAYSKE